VRASGNIKYCQVLCKVDLLEVFYLSFLDYTHRRRYSALKPSRDCAAVVNLKLKEHASSENSTTNSVKVSGLMSLYLEAAVIEFCRDDLIARYFCLTHPKPVQELPRRVSPTEHNLRHSISFVTASIVWDLYIGHHL
jgi:hypothetical protein